MYSTVLAREDVPPFLIDGAGQDLGLSPDGPTAGTPGNAALASRDPVVLCEAVDGLLDDLAEVVYGGAVDDEELVTLVERLDRLERRLVGERLRAVAEIDARQAHVSAGMRSTADLLAERLSLTPGRARAQRDAAVALAAMPATAKAVRTGEVPVTHAEVAARALADVSANQRFGRTDSVAVAELDAVIAEAGPRLDRSALSRRVDDWTASAHPDRLESRERRAWRRRQARLSHNQGPDHMSVLHAELDGVAGAHLDAALAALSRPSGAEDPRTGAQRLADALTDLAKRALDSGDLPQVAAKRPHVLVHATPEALAGDPDAAPGTLDGIGPVSPATASLLACDADVTPIVRRNDEILDVGRTRRTPTLKQRLAVIARDTSCVGCGAAASRSVVHHIRWWHRDAGPTDLENLVLVCANCHFHIHHHRWTVSRGCDGRFEIAKPTPSWAQPTASPGASRRR
jgi:hypothetical protein